MNNTAPHCVHCGKEMPYGANINKCSVSVCHNPACPNYGLLQMGMEKMSEIKEEEIT